MLSSALVGVGGNDDGSNDKGSSSFALPPRILLLALYLMFTLSAFWILDSIKEPTLALLVPDRDLGKHQPRAKMVSFVVVVLLAFVMELVVRDGRRRRRRRRTIDHEQRPNNLRGGRRRHRTTRRDDGRALIDERNAALEKSWQDRNLPSCMQSNDEEEEDNDDGGWRNMGIKRRWHELRQWHWRSTTMSDDDDYHDDDDGDDTIIAETSSSTSSSSSSKISITAFYFVGAIYMKAFIAVALILRHYYPSMSQLSSSSSSSSSSWYYTALGYLFFALVESYGSVSITLFWSFANSHLTLEAAERYYGSTVALAQAGAIGGSTLVAVLGRRTSSTMTTTNTPMMIDEVTTTTTTDDIVGFATTSHYERVSVIGTYGSDTIDSDSLERGGGVRDGKNSDATPTLIFLACGCIFAGMAIMVLYARLFARPMMSQQQQQQQSSLNYNRIMDHSNEINVVEVNDSSDIINKCIDREVDDRPLVVDCQPPPKHDDYQEDDGEYVNERNSYINSNSSINNSSSSSSSRIFADLLGGVYMIYQYEYLQLVLAVSVLYEIALTCMHYEMNLLGLDRFGVGEVDNASILVEHGPSNNTDNGDDDGGGITFIQFLGWYGQTVNILSLFLSFYAFPRLIQNYGLSSTIRIFPTVLLLVTIFAFILFPKNLYFLFISLSICKALTYSIHDPAEEVLYMPTSDDAKFRAKFWIDVVGQRIAKAIGSAINNYAGSVEEIVKYGSLPSIVSALALWLVCYQVGNQFDTLIKSGEVVGLSYNDDDDDDGEVKEQSDDMELSEIDLGENNS